uniref:Uncharacterized protein n=1 Tax=Anguilla anguilla TaxID=7936 RepID=A0A0E9SKM3_ANGAN
MKPCSSFKEQNKKKTTLL